MATPAGPAATIWPATVKMGARPEVAKEMVLVPMTRAVEPSDMGVPPMNVPGAFRVRVASPTTTWVGITVTVTAPGAAVGDCGAGVIAG